MSSIFSLLLKKIYPLAFIPAFHYYKGARRQITPLASEGLGPRVRVPETVRRERVARPLLPVPYRQDTLRPPAERSSDRGQTKTRPSPHLAYQRGSESGLRPRTRKALGMAPLTVD